MAAGQGEQEMQYTIPELLWLMLIYSFIGWVLETAAGSIKSRKFVNRGFSTGPLCLVYGVSAVLLTLTMQELSEHFLALFFGCMTICTAVEWFTGKILERLNQHKWWDYSNKRWNFDGYICLQYSLLWGILGALSVRYFNYFLTLPFGMLPHLLQVILLLAAFVLMALDIVASLAAVLRMKREIAVAGKWHNQLTAWTQRLGLWIVGMVGRRIEKAYPMLKEASIQIQKQGKFAEGCGFYKLFWLFLTGSLLGDFAETVFCRLTVGVWMSRSSLVWGPFSLVWGIAIAVATALLYKDRDKPDRHLFFVGVFLGGAYEYICSVFTELVFGKVFWDYSGIPFNLGGRINLLYCFFWGIVAVIWIKLLYPRISGWIEKIPVIWGYVLTWILVVFMAVNIAVSMLALIRYDMRENGRQAEAFWERAVDEHFDNERMERIYPNAISR